MTETAKQWCLGLKRTMVYLDKDGPNRFALSGGLDIFSSAANTPPRWLFKASWLHENRFYRSVCSGHSQTLPPSSSLTDYAPTTVAQMVVPLFIPDAAISHQGHDNTSHI